MCGTNVNMTKSPFLLPGNLSSNAVTERPCHTMIVFLPEFSGFSSPYSYTLHPFFDCGPDTMLDVVFTASYFIFHEK
jgi:hypothetical protein